MNFSDRFRQGEAAVHIPPDNLDEFLNETKNEYPKTNIASLLRFAKSRFSNHVGVFAHVDCDEVVFWTTSQTSMFNFFEAFPEVPIFDFEEAVEESIFTYDVLEMKSGIFSLLAESAPEGENGA